MLDSNKEVVGDIRESSVSRVGSEESPVSGSLSALELKKRKVRSLIIKEKTKYCWKTQGKRNIIFLNV